MAKMFMPDPKRLSDLGFASVAHVPVLFDGKHRYCQIHNRFLRERALGEWSPKAAADPTFGGEIPAREPSPLPRVTSGSSSTGARPRSAIGTRSGTTTCWSSRTRWPTGAGR